MSDLEAIFDVVTIVHGHLLEDELAPDMVQAPLSRLTNDGPLPTGASAGELNALLADLCQRMHWAMLAHDDYPEPRPRQTTYYLDVPDEEVENCMAALTDLGGDVSRPPAEDRPPRLAGRSQQRFLICRRIQATKLALRSCHHWRTVTADI